MFAAGVVILRIPLNRPHFLLRRLAGSGFLVIILNGVERASGGRLAARRNARKALGSCESNLAGGRDSLPGVSDSCKPEESPPDSRWRLGLLGDSEELGDELPHLLA